MLMGARKWIVTGGAGFIGSNVAHALAGRGYEVIVLDSLVRPSARLNLEWLGDSVTLVEGDVRDRELVDRVVREHADAEAVLHLAGQVAVTSSVASPREDFEANVLGSFNVLEATREYAPEAAFVNVSTNKVYGQLAGHRLEELETRYAFLDHPDGIDETQPLDPHSPYGCSKAAADLYALDYARIYGLRAVSLRQSCIYGPRQFGIEDQGWVAWFAIAARLGLPLTVYGNGKQVRDLLYVDDLVELYLRVVERAGAVAGRAYNVGGGPANTLSLLELLARLGVAEPEYGEVRPGDQLVFVADVARAREDFGWSPQTGLDAGLDSLLAWIEQNVDVATSILHPA
jgi:CDP-paratose 2-epimerase